MQFDINYNHIKSHVHIPRKQACALGQRIKSGQALQDDSITRKFTWDTWGASAANMTPSAQLTVYSSAPVDDTWRTTACKAPASMAGLRGVHVRSCSAAITRPTCHIPLPTVGTRSKGTWGSIAYPFHGLRNVSEDVALQRMNFESSNFWRSTERDPFPYLETLV